MKITKGLRSSYIQWPCTRWKARFQFWSRIFHPAGDILFDEDVSRKTSRGSQYGMRRCNRRSRVRRGPEPWEAKSSLRTRTSYDRSVYIRGYSDSKEVSFYPCLEPAYPPASLSSISYLSRYPAFSTLGSFRWHVIRPMLARATNCSRISLKTLKTLRTHRTLRTPWTLRTIEIYSKTYSRTLLGGARTRILGREGARILEILILTR